MSYNSLFEGEQSGEGRVLFCEDDNFQYWISRNDGNTWVSIESRSGFEYQRITDSQAAGELLSDLFQSDNCIGGHKQANNNAYIRFNQ